MHLRTADDLTVNGYGIDQQNLVSIGKNLWRLSEVGRPLVLLTTLINSLPATFFFALLLRWLCICPTTTCGVTVHQRADTVHLCRKTMQAVQLCDLKFHQSAGTTMFPLSRCRWSHRRRISAVMKVRKYTHRRD